ncbi:hypothetical protein SETIT_6G186400v2 [Setaria italica]|uniref:RING-type E3 ubiquitin transferase n=1 Tax=Setaria italica TaxID=4555 RepID=A0A368RN03_SETIT|nr:E3 ubiquitin-protein ligase ATL6 [Setaria italica]RCV31542.1 hypothetical protein SETIT_6G186400v2 [Setaria italica]
MGPSNGRRLRLVLVAVALAGAAVDAVTAQQGPRTGPGPGPSYFDPKNFNPSMAIVMVVLVTAFFLLGFFSIYLRRCAGPPLGGPDDDGYPAGGRRPLGIAYASRSSRRAARGLDRAVLESFPTMAYADVKAHKVGKGALECAVCLSEFDDDETLRLLPRCSHAFHADCIDAWLASHVTCPVCRAVLAPDYYEAAPAPPLAPASAVSAAEQDAPRQQAPETATAPEQAAAAVVVVVDAEETEEERNRREEAAELMRIGSVKRALRSKSGRQPAQFPRSHTTGHSLAGAAPAEASERYTLRLPEHVLREVVAASSLRRSASVQAGGDGSARRGFGGARAGRSVRLGSSGRWPNMSMLARTFSARLPAWGSARRGEADAPAKGAKVAGDGKAEEQCDGGACPLGAHV